MNDSDGLPPTSDGSSPDGPPYCIAGYEQPSRATLCGTALDASRAEEDDIMAEAALIFERPPEEIEYPESDGEPMAETDDHRDELAELVFTLKDHFRGQGDVYVSGKPSQLAHRVYQEPLRVKATNFCLVHNQDR